MYIDYDLEDSPLQIRTDSVLGSKKEVLVTFYSTGSSRVGGVYLYFSSPPQYQLIYCTSGINFPTDLPSDTDKVWTIILSRVSDEIRVVIHCNDKEVVNVVLSDISCSSSGWSWDWSRDVEEIMFSSDKASDYYRPGTLNRTMINVYSL